MRTLSRLLSLLLVLATPVWAAAPSRTYTYTTGQTIDPSQVTTNEDNIFTYLQAGVDTYAAASITAAAIADGAVASSEISDGTIVNADVSTSAAIAFSKLATLADDSALVGNSSSVPTATTITNCTDTSGQHLNYTQATNSFSCGTSDMGGTNASRVVRTAGDVTTASTSLVDLTSMSLTFTTGANPVLLGFTGSCASSDAAQSVNLNFQVDNTTLLLGTEGIQYNQHATINETVLCTMTAMTAALTAASHTFDVQWSSTDGAATATMRCGTDRSCLMWATEVVD